MNVIRDAFKVAFSKPITYVGLLAIPLIVCVFGYLYAVTFSDPYERMKDMRVAIVNLDEGAVVDGDLMNYGASVQAAVLHNDSVRWTEEGESVASEQGVSETGYYMAVVIPEDFSRCIAAGKNAEPQQAHIEFFRNVRKNFMLATLGKTVEAELRQTVNAEVAREYARALALGLQSSAEGMEDAAEGARKLTEGLGDATDGASKLSDGATQLKEGASVLADGASSLRDGSKEVATGTGEAKSGASALKSGSKDLSEGATALASGASELKDGTGALASGASALKSGANAAKDGAATLKTNTSKLATGASDLASGASSVADGAAALAQATSKDSQLVQSVDALAQGLASLKAGSGKLESGASEVSDGLDAFVGTLSSKAGDLANGADGVAGGAADLAAGASSLADSLGALSDGWDSMPEAQRQGLVQKLAQSAQEVSDAAGKLEAGASELASGVGVLQEQLGDEGSAAALLSGARSVAESASQVASGAATASEGAQTLVGGIRTLSKNIDALNEGAAGVSSGAATLNSGAGTLDKGAGALVQGIGDLTDGAANLESGASSVDKGADDLAQGASDLKAGASTLGDGTASLYNGIVALDEGASKLRDGAVELADGSSVLDDGAGELVNGSVELAQGVSQAHDGSAELGESLSEGAHDIESSLTATPDKYADYISEPAVVDDRPVGDLARFGFGFAPLFLTICLWLASLLTFFIFDPFPSYDAFDAGRFEAVLGRWPLYLVMVACVVVALSAVAGLVGLQATHFVWLVVCFAVIGVSFMALLQAFSLFDIPGKAVAILVLIVQIVCGSGTFPAQLGSDFSATVTAFLPFTYAIDAYREVLSGGNFIVLVHDLAMVVAFGAGGLAVSLLSYPLAKKLKLRNDRATLARLRAAHDTNPTGNCIISARGRNPPRAKDRL